jgi:hypothetical protein
MVQGCGNGEDKDKGNGNGQTATIRGAVIAVDDYKQGEGRIFLMEVTKENGTQYDRASVSIPKDAKMFAMADGKKNKASLADLKSGQSLEVVITGPVMESYPVQVNATEVVITGGGDTGTK